MRRDFPESLARNIEPFAAELLFKWRWAAGGGPLPPSPLPSPIPATLIFCCERSTGAHPEGPAASRYAPSTAMRIERSYCCLSVDPRKGSITALRDEVLDVLGASRAPAGAQQRLASRLSILRSLGAVGSAPKST